MLVILDQKTNKLAKSSHYSVSDIATTGKIRGRRKFRRLRVHAEKILGSDAKDRKQ